MRATHAHLLLLVQAVHAGERPAVNTATTRWGPWGTGKVPASPAVGKANPGATGNIFTNQSAYGQGYRGGWFPPMHDSSMCDAPC
eukprot:CAMPEP_0179854198 /NCGR_PEP_ID=MMETSP0982-20121206/9797_1 /TAXON_ID=483367 /ORGANISM="non described non described, Strain CCMP 2436" /LENGTH=84 /DNA_ID=CAMNT_0021740051 /DNA_START=385 /DNA_END=636 /DNA_ORIENTATION=-